MTGLVPRLALGLALSACIGFLAWRRQTLSQSGIVGAIVVGTLLFGFGGVSAGLLLIAFFVSSSSLSKYGARRVSKVSAMQFYDKSGNRDIWQALANGGCAALLAVAHAAFLDVNEPVAFMLYAGFIGALATATADTWATELGVLGGQSPRMITNLRLHVPPGTSGAVSIAGTIASVAGALFIGVAFAAFTTIDGLLFPLALHTQWLGNVYFSILHTNWFGLAPSGIAVFVIAAVASGSLGSAFDSLLGATCQALYRPAPGLQLTEKRSAADGSPNELLRGWRSMTNDSVNFLSTVAGALIAMFIFVLFVFL